jgi:hypothetical protein
MQMNGQIEVDTIRASLECSALAGTRVRRVVQVRESLFGLFIR